MKNYAGELLYFLPWYDKENITFVDMARVIELSFRFLEKQLGIVERNFFVETALEVLPIYQRDLGLQINANETVEQRRKIIQGYLHYLHRQTTEQVVRDLCKSFNNESSMIDIRKALEEDTFDLILYLNEGLPVNYEDLYDLLMKVLPAHLVIITRIFYVRGIALETQSGDYTYEQFLCGLHICGTIPRIRWEGEASYIDLKVDTGIDDAKNYKPLSGEKHTAPQLYNDRVVETINMTSFQSYDYYSFEK